MTSENNIVEATAPLTAKIAGVATQAGAATAVVGGLTVNEWGVVGVVGGLVLSVLSLGVGKAIDWHWKKKAHELAVENAEFDRRQRQEAVDFERRHRARRGTDIET